MDPRTSLIPPIFLLAALSVLPARCPAASSGPVETPGRRLFQKGVAFTGYSRYAYAGEKPLLSLKALGQTGANWVSILATWYQDTADSTSIQPAGDLTPSDASVGDLIVSARGLGLKVMLKAHVDLLDDAAHYRGEIGPRFTAADWAAWFDSYRAFILHYARIARDFGAEQFCVGCELGSTVSHETEWRNLIALVREVYKGPLVYADDQIEKNPGAVVFWDAVDFIGIDAYPTLTRMVHPSLQSLRRGWLNYLQRLRDLADRWRKPLILTEIGYRSVEGGAQNPWDWQREGPVDLGVQETCYEAALLMTRGRPWLAGVYFWQWLPDPRHGGRLDTGYSPHRKPAERVLRSWFRKRR
ncbi:MAG: hypothetical protein PHX45_08230 [Acidobacteriota bacterium]|nr:hypothetical protein [Acidobacteriota bacterium]